TRSSIGSANGSITASEDPLRSPGSASSTASAATGSESRHAPQRASPATSITSERLCPHARRRSPMGFPFYRMVEPFPSLIRTDYLDASGVDARRDRDYRESR